MFVNVIVPLPLPEAFTYRLPAGLSLAVGAMVDVPFGKTGSITGIVLSVSEQGPDDTSKIKTIIRVLPHQIGEREVRLIEFVSNYYMAPPGQTALVALPPGMLSSSGVADDYRPLRRTVYSLADNAQEHLAQMTRAPKQLQALTDIIAGKPILEIDSPIRQALVKRGALLKREITLSRIDTSSHPTAEPFVLTELQQAALSSIRQQFKDKQTVLLHGVTGSGKTEIYLNLIFDYLRSGGQVLYLVPETGLTQHLYNRLKAYFGALMGVYHTQCSQAERTETYLKQLSDTPYQLVLGTRASLFLHFNDLKLIVIDEEHDQNYKQTERVPYYNARDTALYLAAIAGAHTLLGSATPSVESYANHKSGKYGYVRLAERYGGARLPQFQIADVRDDRRKKRLKGHFTRLLLKQIEAALSNHHQVILFQDRVGYSPYVQCSECNYIPRCPNCGVPLKYSRANGVLRCRYCGYTEPFRVTCPQCGAATIEPRGLGIEQIEDEARALFPNAKTMVVTQKNMAQALFDFSERKLDILIGTRRIIKGIDYHNVTVLGVMDVDLMLKLPDFRSTEQAYQLLVQAAGRTGRAGAAGRIVIQTRQVDDPFLQQIKDIDAIEFYEQQIAEREWLNYPPTCRLIKITLRHASLSIVAAAGAYLTRYLTEVDPNLAISPIVEPPVEFKGNMHFRELVLKMKPECNISKVKHALAVLIATLRKTKEYDRGVYTVDVDPI